MIQLFQVCWSFSTVVVARGSKLNTFSCWHPTLTALCMYARVIRAWNFHLREIRSQSRTCKPASFIVCYCRFSLHKLSFFFMMIHQTKWTRTFNRFMTLKKSEEKKRSLNDQSRGLLMTFLYPQCGWTQEPSLKISLYLWLIIDAFVSGAFTDTVVCCVWRRCGGKKSVSCFNFFLFLDFSKFIQLEPDRVQRKSLSEVIKVHEQLQFALSGRSRFYR